MFRLVPAFVLDRLLAAAAYAVWYACLALHRPLKFFESLARPATRASPHAGKTVLVTTGRQAKTLHGVRALKELGCRVVVTDYQQICASAVSTACDAAAVLAPLDPSRLLEWVEHLEGIIRREKVDLVLPMSTINEALFIGVAKDWLAGALPHVRFLCEGLDLMARLDNKALFAEMCQACGVPVPESGVVTSRQQLEDGSVPFSNMDVILKRIESSANREEEIKVVVRGGQAPASVRPSAADPWQWQRLIRGVEYSAWFVCVEGRITFQGCYRSEGDLLFFDGLPVPEDVEEAIARLIAKHRLTGQYAFDYFREEGTGRFYVIECNPRASSVLEGVSGTPGWGASFFGDDVRATVQYQKVGFWFHRNCWPFVRGRSEGFWTPWDPLPLLVGEVAWPLEMLRTKGALRGGPLPRAPVGLPPEAGTPLTAMLPSLFEALGVNYHHLDVNIGKVIVPGPSPGRQFEVFEDLARDPRASFLRAHLSRAGPAPRVLCDDPEVEEAAAALPGGRASVVRLGRGIPAELGNGPGRVLPGSPRSTMRALALEGATFDAAVLPKALLAELPPGLLAPGGRVVPLEHLPPRSG